jgi:hypothetical protein
MSRYDDYASPSDPLQRRRSVTAAYAKRAASPHPLHAGLAALAPRLGLVFLAAGAVQLLLHWIGR